MSGTRGRMRLALIGALMIVGSLAIVATVLARGPKKVELEYIPGLPGSECLITVDKPFVEIWTKKYEKSLTKRTKVKWKVINHPREDYFWKIIGKTGDAPLGPVDEISCGSNKKETTSKMSSTAGDWDYYVEVWDCDSGMKLCFTDPKVRIKD